MPTTSDYLTQLQQDRDDLVDNLEAKGITGLTGDETFTELVPEVLNIPSGGGGFPPDWTEIGYEETPSNIIEVFNYAKDIYDNWDSSITSLNNTFLNDRKLTIFPLVDTSNVTNMTQTFAYSNLLSLPLIDTSKVTDFNLCFSECRFINFPLLDFSSGANFNSAFVNCVNLIEIPKFTFTETRRYEMISMFSGCKSLKNFPPLKIKNVSDVRNMFSYCPSLTDESLDNILQMCMSATLYTGTKKFARLGFASTDYPASRIQALPHYQDFIEAGWTIGY